MLASWAIITALNIGWTFYLWRRRHRDDPWLWKFFTTYTFTDATMWLGGDPSIGGLNILTQDLLGRDLWIAWICIFWFSWILAPLYAALKIARDRVGWGWISVTAGAAVLLSVSESLGLSSTERRFLMHRLFEPVLLLAAILVVVRASVSKIRDGEMPDYFALVVVATATLLLVRLTWLYDGGLLLQRVGARVLYFVYMFAIIVTHHYDERIRRWIFRPF
jgi:hypothetical protein